MRPDLVCVKANTLHNITYIAVAYTEGVIDEQRWGWRRGRAARGALWWAESIQGGEDGTCHSFVDNTVWKRLYFLCCAVKCAHLVPPAVCYVLPEQEEKLPEKSHHSKQLPGHDGELEHKTKCREKKLLHESYSIKRLEADFHKSIVTPGSRSKTEKFEFLENYMKVIWKYFC